MPTTSEPLYQEFKERLDGAIKDFIEASPGTVSDSSDVLRARLFGLGLRGESLNYEVKNAQLQQLTQRKSHTLRIHQPLWGGFPKLWAIGPLGSIAWTEDSNKAGKYTLQECGTLREQIKVFAPNTIITIDGF